MAAQHADQHGVDACQQARLGPARQAPAQGRATGLVGRGGQAAPRRALAQKPAQGGQHANGCGGRVTTPAMTRPPTRVDHRCDEMQNPDVQGRCPFLSLQTWAAAGQAGRAGISIRGNCENYLLARREQRRNAWISARTRCSFPLHRAEVIALIHSKSPNRINRRQSRAGSQRYSAPGFSRAAV